MSNIIPFDSGNLPSHFKSGGAVSVNSDLTAHAGGGFPVISIKGKVFAIVRDGCAANAPLTRRSGRS